MEKSKGDFQTLYQREDIHPPGLPLETHMDPSQVNSETPSYVGLEAAVHCLIPLKAGGHAHVRAEHFKQWLQEARTGDNSNTPL